jgi:hypothetical protein
MTGSCRADVQSWATAIARLCRNVSGRCTDDLEPRVEQRAAELEIARRLKPRGERAAEASTSRRQMWLVVPLNYAKVLRLRSVDDNGNSLRS